MTLAMLAARESEKSRSLDSVSRGDRGGRRGEIGQPHITMTAVCFHGLTGRPGRREGGQSPVLLEVRNGLLELLRLSHQSRWDRL